MTFNQSGENRLDAVSSRKHNANKLALYRKYRPKIFADIVGQPHIVEILRAEVTHNATAHAYIFIGPRGTGKTSTARILAKALSCRNLGVNGDPCNRCDVCTAINEGSFVDLIEIDAASNRGIDNIREIQERVAFPPNQGRKKVYIIDEVHMLTKEAFNALLKTLEEPPEHVVFILATTEPHKVPETIMSRCERLDFHLADNQTLLAHLRNIASLEGITIEDKAAVLLVEQARGSFRDLLTLLDSVYAVSNEITEEIVRRTLRLPDEKFIRTILYVVFAKEVDGVIKVLQHVEHQGINMTTLLSDLIRFTRDRLLLDPSLSAYRGQFIQLIATLFKAFDNIQFVFDSVLLVESTLHRYMLTLKEPLVKVTEHLKAGGIVDDLIGSPMQQDDSTLGHTVSNSLNQETGVTDNDKGSSNTDPPPLEGASEPNTGGASTNDSARNVSTPYDTKKIEQASDNVKDKTGNEGDLVQVSDKTPVESVIDSISQEKLLAAFREVVKRNAPSYLYSYMLHARVHKLEPSGKGRLRLVLRAPDYAFYKQKTQNASIQNILNRSLGKALGSMGVAGITGEVKIEYDRRLNGSKSYLRLNNSDSSKRVNHDLSGTRQVTVSKNDDDLSNEKGNTEGANSPEADWLTVFGGDLERLS